MERSNDARRTLRAYPPLARLALVCAALSVASCGEPPPSRDAGPRDASAESDAGPLSPDGGDAGSDAGGLDAGDARDAGAPSTALSLTGEAGEPGEGRALLGMSIQVPDMADHAGATLAQSALGDRWRALPRSFFRFPAGTDSYTRTEDDALVRYFLEDFLEQYPGVANDQTWSPHLPVATFRDWVHPRLQRITLGNEPPNHPPHFPTDGAGPGAAYVAFAREVIAAYPDLDDQFWIQTGKPEVVRYAADAGVGATGIFRHNDLLDAASAAVEAGELPARIVTTHKLLDFYPADRLGFYRELLDDYRSYFGEDVQICFQEAKYKAEDHATLRSALRTAEFFLILSRLRFEQGEIISGAAYQQGFGAGTSNLIGLDAPETRRWTATALTDLWEEFAGALFDGRYLASTFADRDPELQVEVFEVAGELRVLFANNSDVDEPLELPVGSTLFRVSGASEAATPGSDRGDYEGALPARTAGVIRLPIGAELPGPAAP